MSTRNRRDFVLQSIRYFQRLAAAANRHLVNSVGVRFPLAEAAAAHEAVERRETVGKVVLIP